MPSKLVLFVYFFYLAVSLHTTKKHLSSTFDNQLQNTSKDTKLVVCVYTNESFFWTNKPKDSHSLNQSVEVTLYALYVGLPCTVPGQNNRFIMYISRLMLIFFLFSKILKNINNKNIENFFIHAFQYFLQLFVKLQKWLPNLTVTKMKYFL